MARWFVVFGVLAVIIIAFCVETASMLASNTTIANIVTTGITFIATLALVLQWHFPQTQAPQPLTRKWLMIASASLLVVTIVGIMVGVFAYNRLLPNDSFAHMVEGKPTVDTDFSNSQWDNGTLGCGSCSPHPQTDSFDVVANPHANNSSNPGGNFSCTLASNLSIAGNMAFQVDMRITNGAVAGVTFKDTNTSNPHNFYLYSINTFTGSFQFTKAAWPHEPAMVDSARTNGTLYKGIDSTNTLELTMIDQRICLYANQSPLHCFRDPQPYETGTIGLFVGTYPGNVTFSALKVWEL